MNIGEKIAKLSKVLNVSYNYLLQEHTQDKGVRFTPTENGYTVDWSNLYPILGKYQQTVDCEQYYGDFDKMVKEMMSTYRYSLQDTFLVLKDLLYQAYLNSKNYNGSKS